MNSPTTLELTVDLGLWQDGREVAVEVPAAVTVGHVADQLALFVGLPLRDEEENRVPYTLRPDDEDGSPIDREAIMADAEITGPVRLSAVSVPYFAQLAAGYEKKIRDAVDTEVDLWLQKGRTLVVGALSDAMNEIRDDLRKRIAPMIPTGLRGVMAQYRAGRALRNLGEARAGVAYTDAVQGGLRLAGRSAGSVLGFAGNAAASTAFGGVAGTIAGAGAGAAAATVLIAIGSGLGWIGTDGEQGVPGADGLPGIEGPAGPAGAVGPAGEPGQPGTAGSSWSVGLNAPTGDTAGDFHLDRCTGVISHRIDGGEWAEIVDLAATQGRAVASACDNLELVTPGQSLWAVVSRRCRDDNGGRLTNSQISRAVAQTWVANLDVVGSTADSVDTDQPLVLRCP